jgi:hypothetical protein
MNVTKFKITIALSILSFLILNPTILNPVSSVEITNSDNSFVLTQTSLDIEFNVSSLSLMRNESGAILVTITYQGSPVPSAAFNITGIDYDMGELVFPTLDQGVYEINFPVTQNIRIAPGNYTLNVEVFSMIDNNRIEGTETFDLELISHDFDIPYMILTDPEEGEVFGKFFKVTIEAFDPQGWGKTEVWLGDNLVFEQAYNYLSVDHGDDLTYNETYFYMSRYLQAINSEGVVELTVMFYDTGFNINQSSRTITVDGKGPTITITSHEDQEEISSRTITLRWNISDFSNISTLSLYFGSFKVKTFDSPYATMYAYNLPIEEDGVTVVELKFQASDQFGNVGVTLLTLIYNSKSDVITDDSEGDRFKTALLLIVTVFSIGGVIYLIFSLRRKEEKIDNFYKPKK